MRGVPGWALVLVGLFGLAAAAAASGPPPVPPWPHREGHVLVAFHSNAASQARTSVLRRLRLSVDPGVRSPYFVRLKLEAAGAAPAASVQATIADLSRDPSVRVAEPDYEVVSLQALPNDPLFPDQWGLHNTGQSEGVPDADIDAPEAWEWTRGSRGVVVAIVDTGVLWTHPDLAPNYVGGYDYGSEDGDPGNVFDLHGTHVAGIACAAGNNGVGISGVSQVVGLMALKYSRELFGGTVGDAIECIDHAVRNGARVINMSWKVPASQLLFESLQRARNGGVLCIAAAGNDAKDNDLFPVYPASYNQQLDNVISVAASDRTESLGTFSNYGRRSVDIAAPGVSILSTYFQWPFSMSWAFANGTSQAAPCVSGAAALVMARYPQATYLQVKQRLLNGVDYAATLAGKVATGRLNANNALSLVLETRADSSHMVTGWFEASPDDVAYSVERRGPGEAGYQEIGVVPAAAPVFHDDGSAYDAGADAGLLPGSTYEYRVIPVLDENVAHYSNEVRVITHPLEYPLIIDGDELVADQISVTWVDTCTVESGFVIERSLSGAAFVPAGMVGPAPGAGVFVTYTDMIDPDTTGSVRYRVQAYRTVPGQTFTSAFSNEWQVTPGALRAPDQLSAVPLGFTDGRYSGNQLQWVDNTLNERGFELERSQDNVTFGRLWTQRASRGLGIVTTVDVYAAFGVTYYYRVRAVRPGQQSDWSNTAVTRTESFPPPVDVTAQADSPTRIWVGWKDASEGEAGFDLERSRDNLTFGRVARFRPSADTGAPYVYADTGDPSTRYYYRVRAFVRRANGELLWSEPSPVVSDVTQAPPAAPDTLVATSPSPRTVELTWVDRSANEDRFLVQISSNGRKFTTRAPDGTSPPTPSTGATVRWSTTGLKSGRRYYFRIRAMAGPTPSDWSAVVSVQVR